jgi:hypothetical protein
MMRLISKMFFISAITVYPCYSLQSNFCRKVHTVLYGPWSFLWCYLVRVLEVHCHFLMDVFSWLKMGSFQRTFNSGKRKHHIMQDLVNTELVGALLFVFQLKTCGQKFFYAPLCCVTAKANSDSTNLIFFLNHFCNLLKHKCRTVGKPSDMVICV